MNQPCNTIFRSGTQQPGPIPTTAPLNGMKQRPATSDRTSRPSLAASLATRPDKRVSSVKMSRLSVVPVSKSSVRAQRRQTTNFLQSPMKMRQNITRHVAPLIQGNAASAVPLPNRPVPAVPASVTTITTSTRTTRTSTVTKSQTVKMSDLENSKQTVARSNTMRQSIAQVALRPSRRLTIHQSALAVPKMSVIITKRSATTVSNEVPISVTKELIVPVQGGLPEAVPIEIPTTVANVPEAAPNVLPENVPTDTPTILPVSKDREPSSSISKPLPSQSMPSTTSEFLKPFNLVSKPFHCALCNKFFRTEIQFKTHNNNFHKIPFNSKKIGTSALLSPLKCKYCDRSFDIQFAYDKHLEENCKKIPPTERKRLLAEKANKKMVGRTAGNETLFKTHFQKSKSDKLSNRLSSMNFLDVDFEPETSNLFRLSSNNLGHSGIFRTPSKAIVCKICGKQFFNCVEFAEHSANFHS